MNCTEATNLIFHNQAEEARILALKKEMRLTEALQASIELKKYNEKVWAELLWRNFEVVGEGQISHEVLSEVKQMWPVELSREGEMLVWVKDKETLMSQDLVTGNTRLIPISGTPGWYDGITYDDYFTIDHQKNIFIRCQDPHQDEKMFVEKNTSGYSEAYHFGQDAPICLYMSENEKLGVNKKNQLVRYSRDLSIAEILTTLPSPHDTISAYGKESRLIFSNYGFRGCHVWDLKNKPLSFQVGRNTAPPVPLRNSLKYLDVRKDSIGFVENNWSQDDLFDLQGVAFVAIDPEEERYVLAFTPDGRGVVFDSLERQEIAWLDYAEYIGGNRIKKLALGKNRRIILGLENGQVLILGKKNR
jgi:hypothetical protein